MSFQEIRIAARMNLTEFSQYFDIPYRTVQNWERGERQPPEYLIELIKYKLQKEGMIYETPD